jgi:hypothetical protein
MKFKILVLVILGIAFTIGMMGCEAENPGEPKANKPPDTYIAEASPGNTTNISFYGTDDDGFVDRFAYKWDTDADWTETTDQNVVFIDAFASEEDTMVFYVKGIDDEGVEDPTPAEITLTPTNALPETELTGGPEFGKTAGEDVTFKFEGEDLDADGSIASFEYTLDSLDNWQETPADYPYAPYLGLSPGVHVFYVRAVDNLGGKDPSPAQVAFIVESDKFRPTIVNKSPLGDGDGWYKDVAIPFQWEVITADYYGDLPDAPFSTAMDDSTNFDSNPYTPLANGWNANPTFNFTPSEGIYTFYLKVRDTAGGVSLMKIRFSAATPTLDNGILVVNGVMPGDEGYGEEIEDRLAQAAYWGSLTVDFIDLFGSADAPGGTTVLPASATYVGNGDLISADFLGQYSTIVWIGNDYGGDADYWSASLSYAYLSAGGNIILASRYAYSSFFNDPLTTYANIGFREEEVTLLEFVHVFPGLKDMTPFDGSLSATDVFSGGGFMEDSGDDNYVTNWDGTSSYTKDDLTTTLLFAHRSSGFDIDYPFGYIRGLGVWSHPKFPFSSQSAVEFPAPGTTEAHGNFIALMGRSYRYNIENMKFNFDFILKNMCGEQ